MRDLFLHRRGSISWLRMSWLDHHWRRYLMMRKHRQDWEEPSCQHFGTQLSVQPFLGSWVELLYLAQLAHCKHHRNRYQGIHRHRHKCWGRPRRRCWCWNSYIVCWEELDLLSRMLQNIQRHCRMPWGWSQTNPKREHLQEMQQQLERRRNLCLAIVGIHQQMRTRWQRQTKQPSSKTRSEGELPWQKRPRPRRRRELPRRLWLLYWPQRKELSSILQ